MALRLAIVAEFARFGAGKDCRGEIGAKVEGGDGRTVDGPELSVISTNILTEGDTDSDVDVRDG